MLGEVLAEDLRGLEEAELIPPRQRIGVLLAGDLYSAPAGDKRGATGDVRPVWSAFARETLWVAGVARRESADGGPIERFAALVQEALKSVVQQAAERHWNVQIRGRREYESDVLESQRRSESRGLKFGLRDQLAVDGVCRRRKD